MHTPVQEQQLVLDFKQAIRQAEVLADLDRQADDLADEIGRCDDVLAEDMNTSEAEELKDQIAARRKELLEDDPELEELMERRKTAMAEVRKTEAYRRRKLLKAERKEVIAQRGEQATNLERGLRNAAK